MNMSTLTKITLVAVLLVVMGQLHGLKICTKEDFKGHCQVVDISDYGCKEVDGKLRKKGVLSIDNEGTCVSFYDDDDCTRSKWRRSSKARPLTYNSDETQRRFKYVK